MNPSILTIILILLSGMAGLLRTAPGFRPSEFSFYARRMIEAPRMTGFLLFVAAFALLLPAAARLLASKRMKTLFASFFVILAALFALDVVGELLAGQHDIAKWILRFAFVSIVAWGFKDLGALKTIARSACDRFSKRFQQAPKGAAGVFLKAYVFAILFLIVREVAHHFLTRGDAPFGDEINWWYTGAKMMMDEGLAGTIRNHGFGFYVSGVPWIISLPMRLLNAHREGWLLGYGPFMSALMLLFVVSCARTFWGLVAAVSVYGFTMLANRDLNFLMSASLYGEAICTLLVALFLYTILDRENSAENPVHLGLYLGFIRFIKPPISILILPYSLIQAALVFRREKLSALKLLAGVVIPYEIWKQSLTSLGKHPEYSVQFSKVFENGIDLSIPWGMLRGLFTPDTPQSAYAWGLIAALAIVISAKAWRVLFAMFMTLAIYWGFVFGLYATYWQKGDYSSAGRYLSHAAIACVMILSLAFSEQKKSTV